MCFMRAAQDNSESSSELENNGERDNVEDDSDTESEQHESRPPVDNREDELPKTNLE